MDFITEAGQSERVYLRNHPIVSIARKRESATYPAGLSQQVHQKCLGVVRSVSMREVLTCREQMTLGDNMDVTASLPANLRRIYRKENFGVYRKTQMTK